jgi:putative transposase
MPRRPRNSTGGLVYHVLNRGIARTEIFADEQDYLAFIAVLSEVQKKLPCRILSFCLMPNHWHLLLWPHLDGDLSEYMRLVTVTHTKRWHAHFGTSGNGPIYQGRYKAFPVKTDRYFLMAARYIEQNPLRAELVGRAENWKWSSLAFRETPELSSLLSLSGWPVRQPTNWISRVNDECPVDDLETVRLCVKRGRPFGDSNWQNRIAKELGSESSLRPRGRPRCD